MMDYFKARGKQMAMGFVVGAPIGFFRADLNGQANLAMGPRLFLSFQIGIAFGLLVVVGYNYLEFRERLKKRIAEAEE